MLLERLILKNFKRFRNQEIQFSDGITGIVGNNGTGKSSIVEGILFALYGLSGTGIKGDFVVSSFAEPREKCEVRLDFRVRGQDYSVRRSYRKGSTSQHDARLNLGEKLLAQGVSDVDREITRILGMNATDLKHTIYAGQKDLIALLENTAGERKGWFSRVLGIDYLKDESLALIRERTERVERQEAHLEGEFAALIQQVEGENPSMLESSRRELEDTISQRQKAAESLKENMRNHEAHLLAIQQEKSRFVRLSERRDSVAREMERIQRRQQMLNTQIAALTEDSATYEQLRNEAERYPIERERYIQEQKKMELFERLSQELSFSHRRLADLERRWERLREAEQEHTRNLRQLTSLIHEVRAQSECPPEVTDASLEQWVQERIHTLARQEGTLNGILEGCGKEREKILQDWEHIREAGMDGVCPLCHQRLGEHYPHLEEEFESRLQEIVGQAEHACELLEIHEGERNRLSSLGSTFGAIRSFGDLNRAKTALAQERQTLDREKSLIIDEADQLDRQLQDLAFDKDIFAALELHVQEAGVRYDRFQEAGKRIATLPVLRQQRSGVLQEEQEKQAEHAAIQRELEGVSFDPSTEKALEDQLVRLRKEYTIEETELARNQERLGKILDDLKRLELVQERIRTAEHQITEYLEEIRMLKLTRTAMSDFVVYLMQVVRAQIEQTAGEVLSIITDERYDRVLLDADFNLRVSDMDDDYPIERFSGGEQDDIAVALRIALSRYLAELHQIHDSTFLIFDEIFGSQDEERRNNLLRALRTQESHFPQIILISHIPEIQGEFATTLVVEMENDQTSVVREAS
jgi:exonuclease SbcC